MPGDHHTLREEINNRDERLQGVASKIIRTPSLKSMMAGVNLSTSQLCEDVDALDSDEAPRPVDKLRSGPKKALAEIDAPRQSIATCIERLQAVLISLDRAKAVIASAPNK